MTSLTALLPLLVVAAMYWRRARTLRTRGSPVPAWRQASFALAIVLAVAAQLVPYEDELFFVHMLQHVLLGDLAALAFVLGLTGPMLRPVLAVGPLSRLRVLAHPLVALPLWAVSLYLWHVPALYEAAVEDDAVHALEHLSFFSTGVLMWSGVVVYDVYDDGTERFGMGPLQDQGLAGTIMMVEGSVVTIGALAWLFLRLAQEGELRQRLLEEGYDPRSVRRAVRYGRGKELEGTG